jgi:hypothetical protein
VEVHDVTPLLTELLERGIVERSSPDPPKNVTTIVEQRRTS